MDVSQASELVAARLASSGFDVEQMTLAGRDALVARRSDLRLQWVATRLHTFVVVFDASDLDEKLAEELTAAAQQHAIKQKGGLPRGLQNGTATVAVFLTAEPRPALHAWFRAEPKHRFAALRFPVLAELGAPAPIYFEERARIGSIYLGHLRGVVTDIIAPALRQA